MVNVNVLILLGVLDHDAKAGSGVPGIKLYGETKFIQLLGALWWRRQLAGQCAVLAVSPGLIPGTGLGRGMQMDLPANLPDAKPVAEGMLDAHLMRDGGEHDTNISIGASSILRAFSRDDLPEDPEQIFLTSWGEWWDKEVYGKTLDVALQEKWCPAKEDIEAEEGLDG